MEDTIKIALTILGSLGGFEFIKWLFNRKSSTRVAQATADSADLKNNIDEFHFLKERIEFKDKQLIEKEERFAKQNEYVIQLNKQLLELSLENGRLSAEISELKAERKMKL